ncbi:MAG: helix-turn-helix domain-containing protein, partial [Myxococcota bacterium]
GSDLVTEDHLVLDDEISVESTARALSHEVHGMVGDDLVSFLPGSEPLTEVRRKIILGTLERFGGNRTRTAEALGVSLRTIRNKLRDYRERGINVPNPGGANAHHDASSDSSASDSEFDDEDGSLRR